MKVYTKSDRNGKTEYSSAIAEQIVRYTLEEMDGVVPMKSNAKLSKKYLKGVKIDMVGGYLFVDVYVTLRADAIVRDIAFKIQQNIKTAMESSTDFKVKTVNVHIVDVDFSVKQEQPEE